MPINILFYGYALLFFFLDIILYGFFEKKFFCFLLSYYSIALLGSFKFPSIIFLSVLIAAELFLEIDHFGIALLPLIIISAIIFYLRPYLYEDACIPIYMVFVCVLLFTYFLKGWFFHYTPIETYTFYTICVNIVILSSMLKFLFKGKRGNRFYFG